MDKVVEYFNGDELAANVFLTKYAMRDKVGNLLETTPDDMHDRLASEFARMENKFPKPITKELILSRLKNFKQIVPQGSPMAGIGHKHVTLSLSNCVVVESPQDNISSIMDTGKEMANLFKRRCGVGGDISELRPEFARVNNSAGTTTGAWSFADLYSFVCRMIGQNGRRGALMISMDVRHPDILQFIRMKNDLQKVTGANVSVRLTDEFMKAVEGDNQFVLRWPVNCTMDNKAKITKTVKAKDIWNAIVESATKTAEPGILMWDNILKRLPANEYEQFKTICTNPCGEIPLSAYDSCRLISINLKHFVKYAFTNKAFFDYDGFKNVVTTAMRMSDDLVELELEHLSKIMEGCDTPDEREMWKKLWTACRNGRRTGLGTHGLADVLARLRLSYDSDAALPIIDKIYKTLKIQAYTTSVNLAEERGHFPAFVWETEKNNEYLNELPKKLLQRMARVGRRNISILTNAPTGSVSILSQTSSGLEPVFRNSYTRRRKLSHNDTNVEADFIDPMGDRWQNFEVYHHNLREFFESYPNYSLPDYFTESNNINWMNRILVQATIQKHIDHSISSTINLPKGTKPEDVGKIYMEGWKRGLKGVTVYVDGSRSGVLITEEKEAKSFLQHQAPKRAEILDCEIHRTTIKGEDWVVLVGMLEDKPYEVFAGLSDKIELPKKYDHGTLQKRSRKTTRSLYDLTIKNGGDPLVIKDVVEMFDNPNNSALTRLISLSLRHGAKMQYVVEQILSDYKNTDFQSFSKVVARVLKKYIDEGTSPEGDKHCESCQSDGLIYVEGCQTCQNCGFAKCG